MCVCTCDLHLLSSAPANLWPLFQMTFTSCPLPQITCDLCFRWPSPSALCPSWHVTSVSDDLHLLPSASADPWPLFQMWRWRCVAAALLYLLLGSSATVLQTFVREPSDQYVRLGQTVVLPCQVSRDGPLFWASWMMPVISDRAVPLSIRNFNRKNGFMPYLFQREALWTSWNMSFECYRATQFWTLSKISTAKQRCIHKGDRDFRDCAKQRLII